MTESGSRHYDDPPLEEAIFELFVNPARQWSPEAADSFVSGLPRYDGKREQLEDINVRLRVGPGREVAPEVDPGAQRLRLWNADQTRAVQISANMCTHNVRKPYGHFEDHVPAMNEVFTAYLATMQPTQLAWVGQRYLNIVKLPADSAPADYFEMYPRLPAALPAGHRPFAVQVETATFPQGTTLVNLALLELRPDAAIYTIDIYARSDATVPLNAAALEEWQARAHASIGESFELTITAKARKLFKEVV